MSVRASIEQIASACEGCLLPLEQINASMATLTDAAFIAAVIEDRDTPPLVEKIIDAGAVFMALAKLSAELAHTVQTRAESLARQHHSEGI